MKRLDIEFKFLTIVFFVFIFIIVGMSINKQRYYEKMQRNCNGRIVKAKYVPSGRKRFIKNIILENDEKMTFTEWSKCELVPKINID